MNRKTTLFLLGMVLSAMFTYAQRAVKGKVTDASDGKAIPGVGISIKGKIGGASVTNADGTFTINAPSNETVLVFSFIGYTSKEVKVGTQTNINVVLAEDNTQLDEVMVVAYGTAKKSSFTGSAAQISAEKIKDMPTTSFQNALVGRAAGVQVTAGSGQAGATANIRVRGIGSMNASLEPLYVVDGVPVVSGNIGQMSDYTNATNNVMNTINPSDIENITILKDAAASSLYGSRAANGVVIITTKKGKSGKPRVEFRTSLGLTPDWATDNYESGSIQDQINATYTIYHDYYTNHKTPLKDNAGASAQAITDLNTRFNKHGYNFSVNGTGKREQVNITGRTDGIVNREGKYFDWEDALFRTGQYQTNDLAVSGGDENTKYYSSLSYTKDKGRAVINDFDRISGRMNLSQKVGKGFEFGANVSFTKSGQSGLNDSRNGTSNYLYQTRNLLFPLYWPTDYKTGLPYTARFGSLAYNNIYLNDEWNNTSTTKRILASPYIQVNLLPNLRLKSILSYDNSQVTDHLYYSVNHPNGSATNGQVNDITTNDNKLVSSSTLNFNKSFNKHNLTFLAGFETEKNVTDFQRSTGTELPSSVLETVVTAGVTSASSYNWGNSMVSGLTRAEYNFDEKYFLSGSYRRDGSSRLHPDTRWSDFWSVGGAWNMGAEDFIKRLSFIDNLKLKASVGTSGTFPSSNYGWRGLTGYNTKYMNQPGSSLSAIPDKNLKWEKNFAKNVGVEFGLMKRFTGSVEYFDRTTDDLLQSVPTSYVTGVGSILKNIGSMNNRGLELELSADIINKGDLKWNAGMNISFTRSKVTKLYKSEGSATGNDIIWNDPTGGDGRARFIYREGESPLSFYGIEWGGVDPTNGLSFYYVNNPSDAAAGDFLHNGRGATYNFNRASRKIIGNGVPDAFGGVNTTLDYKGFSLGLVFNYKIGGELYDGANKDVADDGYYFERLRSKNYLANMWTPTNTNGSQPEIDGGDYTDAMQISTRNLHDASFLRLKNVVLAYRLPKSVLSKVGSSNARIYFNATNLLTFSKYKEADPEVGQYSTRGWEIPFGKTYTFGLEFSF